MRSAYLFLLSLPIAVLSKLRYKAALEVALGHRQQQLITDFCWGKVTILGQIIKSTGNVKGAILIKKDEVGGWDWSQHEVDFGDMMKYHSAGIQPEEVMPFIQARQPVIILTAGVVGVLNLSDGARKAIADASYELLDLAEDNARAEAIGEEVFHAHCKAGSLVLDNLSPRGKEGLRTAIDKVKQGKPLVLRAYTGDALIIANEMHEQFPDLAFSGLLHSNC
uniref:Uncharacterized protein n=1 Tax=Alexandrium catenella TaxID=2925 RepID=A0A7S1S1Q6_ALECA